MNWWTCFGTLSYRAGSEGDITRLEAREKLLSNPLMNKMWLQNPRRKKKKAKINSRELSRETFNSCTIQSEKQDIVFALRSWEIWLACSGSCVPRNVNRKCTFDCKPRNWNSLVGKQREEAFLLTLLLHTNMRNPHFKVRGWHFKQQFPHPYSLD